MNQEYENIVEGLLFLSSNSGISIGEIVLTLNIEESLAVEIIESLAQRYTKNGGLKLINTNHTYKLVTKSEYYEYFKRFANLNNETKLGNSTLEVLAVIAYKQPITKYEIEQLKGVSINYHLGQLLNKDLIYVSDRKKEIGTPNLFSTTDNFLDFIGLNTLEELPDLKTFKFNMESTSLLNFEEFDFKQLSEQLLNNDNTIELKDLDEDILNEIDEIDGLKFEENIFKENDGKTTEKDSE